MKDILVCDDEAHIVEGVRHLLRAADRRVRIAYSGTEALQLIEAHVPDLLVLDIMMPEMSGLEVVATLRGVEATKHLPVIILTAKGQAQDASMAQEVWGAFVVAKPFDPKKLRHLVSVTLENASCPEPASG